MAMNDPERLFLQRIAENVNRENRVAAIRTAERVSEAKEEAARLARAFAGEDPALRRAVLFGSVARGRVSGPDFDIDLGIEGGDILRYIAVAEKSSFTVDVVDLQNVSEEFRRLVLSEAVTLYEARQ
ncbi:MAG: nucleotidyltransferase domain-containing protein [Spirochaetia bacterium]|jgi:predicted nucleotidyltransferase